MTEGTVSGQRPNGPDGLIAAFVGHGAPQGFVRLCTSRDQRAFFDVPQEWIQSVDEGRPGDPATIRVDRGAAARTSARRARVMGNVDAPIGLDAMQPFLPFVPTRGDPANP